MNEPLQGRSAPSFPITKIQLNLEHVFISLANCRLVLNVNEHSQQLLLLSDLLLEASIHVERALEDMRKHNEGCS